MMHLLPFSLLWNKGETNKKSEAITTQQIPKNILCLQLYQSDLDECMLEQLYLYEESLGIQSNDNNKLTPY